MTGGTGRVAILLGSSVNNVTTDRTNGFVIGGTLLIGGAGTVSGTLCGVLLLGVVQNVIDQIGNLTSSVQSVVSGAFPVVVVVTQSFLSRVRRLR
jgi:ribose transport system permease protein